MYVLEVITECGLRALLLSTNHLVRLKNLAAARLSLGEARVSHSYTCILGR